MKFELILAVDSGDGQITNVQLAHMTRPDVSELVTLGLSLPESKQLLAQLQQKSSPGSSRQRRNSVGTAGSAARSGPSRISMGRGSGVCSAMSNSGCRGWRKCQCAVDSPVQGSGNATLRPRWIAPELECVQSELAAVLPYARSAELLSKLLPIGAGNRPAQCALAPCTSDNAWNRS